MTEKFYKVSSRDQLLIERRGADISFDEAVEELGKINTGDTLGRLTAEREVDEAFSILLEKQAYFLEVFYPNQFDLGQLVWMGERWEKYVQGWTEDAEKNAERMGRLDLNALDRATQRAERKNLFGEEPHKYGADPGRKRDKISEEVRSALEGSNRATWTGKIPMGIVWVANVEEESEWRVDMVKSSVKAERSLQKEISQEKHKGLVVLESKNRGKDFSSIPPATK